MLASPLMSTLPLGYPHRGSGGQSGGSAQALRTRIRAVISTPVALAGALLAALLYAAFAHGAAGSPAELRLQVAIAALAAIAGAGLLWSGTLRFSAPALALTGVGLLASFALWSGVTLLWSVAPDQTWIELNRVLTYVIVLCLAIALGASHRLAVTLISKGFLVLAMAVTIYALGQELAPGLHVTGLFDLNQTGQVPRLQEPFGYWNALALFLAMGVPSALALAIDVSRGARSRLGALLAVELMVLAIGFTYSRGGVLALVVGLAVGVALSGARLRSLMWLIVVLVCTAPPLIFGLFSHPLTAANVALGQREIAGGELAAVLLGSVVVLALGGWKVLRLERRIEVGPERTQRIGHGLLALVGVALVAGVLAAAFSARGLDSTVSHAWSNFTATSGTSVDDPNRLISADSGHRWVWWKEAAGAFSDRPAGGWGAGSFRVVQPLYLHDGPRVNQPHSVPLQFLAETGIVGALLAIGGFALLLGTGVGTVRRRAAGGERMLAAALLAGAVAYAVHCFYDWDWDIPGVTLPAVVFLGVLAGARGRRASERSPLGAASRPVHDGTGWGPGTGVRALSLGALTFVLCSFTLSVVLPNLAASKASSAVVAAGSSSARLAHAQSEAELASRLDPLSDAGPRAEAVIAIHRGALVQARADLLEAIGRNPSDIQAWSALSSTEQSLNELGPALRSAHQVLVLDPQLGGKVAATLFDVENLLAVPPRSSATAVRTPLPSRSAPGATVPLQDLPRQSGSAR